MKKSLLALAALGVVAGSAQAQSSVTLYGVADMNLEYVTNMSSVTPSAANGLSVGPAENLFRMSSGGLSGSRWGLRGVEDRCHALRSQHRSERAVGGERDAHDVAEIGSRHGPRLTALRGVDQGDVPALGRAEREERAVGGHLERSLARHRTSLLLSGDLPDLHFGSGIRGRIVAQAW